MKFTIRRRTITVTIHIQHDVAPPLRSKRLAREIAERVDERSTNYSQQANILFRRTKALYHLAQEKGWDDDYGFGLKASKDFVERVFSGNGHGNICL